MVRDSIAQGLRRVAMLRPFRHPDTAVLADALGTRYPEYRPTFRFAGPYIDTFHRSLDAAGPDGLIDIGLKGWLRPADALKLYELAWFSPGDMLEFGTFHGLSTHIISRALLASGQRARVTSLELVPEYADETAKHLFAPAASHRFIVGDARKSAQGLIDSQRRFGFAFVDHSHGYELVEAACQHLKHLVVPGGFALFHDYNDHRNVRNDPSYGVFQAVGDAFADGSFVFWGVYGCTGLYRRSRRSN